MSFLPVLYRKKELIVYKDKKINTKRRTFLKKSALAGLALALPINLYPKKVKAMPAPALIITADLLMQAATLILAFWTVYKNSGDKPYEETTIINNNIQTDIYIIGDFCDVPCEPKYYECNKCYDVYRSQGTDLDTVKDILQNGCPNYAIDVNQTSF